MKPLVIRITITGFISPDPDNFPVDLILGLRNQWPLVLTNFFRPTVGDIRMMERENYVSRMDYYAVIVSLAMLWFLVRLVGFFKVENVQKLGQEHRGEKGMLGKFMSIAQCMKYLALKYAISLLAICCEQDRRWKIPLEGCVNLL